MTNCTQMLIPYYRLVYTGIFLPCVIFSLLTYKHFCPVLNSPRHSCVQREIIWDNGIHPVLILLHDNEGEKGKNKMGENISPIQ